MSKEYYKKCIIDDRAQIAKERERKKKDNARYAALIKSARDTATKANYRKSKIDVAARHDAAILRLKKIMQCHQDNLKRCK